MRAAHRGARVPILALTANASGIDRERCFAAGMDGYCGKPFKPSELLDAMVALMASPDESATSTHAHMSLGRDQGRSQRK